MRIKTFILSSILFLTLESCHDTYVSSIPDLPVSLQLNLTTTYPTFKNSINQYLLFEKRIFEMDRIGYGGVLVCTGISLDDYGNSVYYAFDLACPKEADKNIKVHPLKDDLGKVKCDSCASVYEVGFGTGVPVSGPSKEPLKKYHTSLTGDNLYIYR